MQEKFLPASTAEITGHCLRHPPMMVHPWQQGQAFKHLPAPGELAVSPQVLQNEDRGALFEALNDLRRIYWLGRPDQQVEVFRHENVTENLEIPTGVRCIQGLHEMAPETLGVEKPGATVGSGSNEATLDGKRVVIKGAARATDSVGVTSKMLGTLDAAIAAFQLDDGSFELWSLPSDAFHAEMRDTRSRGAAAGKVGLVRRGVFSSRGRLVGRVRTD